MLDGKALPIFNRPICQNLRTKAIYIPGGNLQNLVENNPGSHYWCNCTMQVVGPRRSVRVARRLQAVS